MRQTLADIIEACILHASSAMLRAGNGPLYPRAIGMNLLDQGSGSAAVMRHASAHLRRPRRPADAVLVSAEAAHSATTDFTVAQRCARYGLTVAAIVAASALFATQLQALML